MEYNKDDFRLLHDKLCSGYCEVGSGSDASEVILTKESQAIVEAALKIAANVMDDAILEKACWSREQHLKRVDWARKVLQK